MKTLTKRLNNRTNIIVVYLKHYHYIKYMIYLITIIVFMITLFYLVSRGIVTMKTKSSSVNESKYLNYKSLKKNIYLTLTNKELICPFNLNIEPMAKLILFDVEDDPLYSTIELQEFDDDISKGLIIILYRKDNEVDVYYTDGIKHDFYKGSNNGVSQQISVEVYTFEKTSDQLNFKLRFTDKDNNKIYIEATEKNSNKKHFDILAPAGDMIDNFDSFPLFFMQKTAFLEKAHSSIVIEISGEKRKPVAIPIAINGKFVFLSRYCLDPVAVSLNENFHGIIKPINSSGINNLNLKTNSDYKEIVELRIDKYKHKAKLKFSPPIPELLFLKNNTKIKGRFSTTVDNYSGIVAGKYYIKKVNDKVHLFMKPLKGWQPMPGKKWFKKYKWKSTISKENNNISINSKWVYKK